MRALFFALVVSSAGVAHACEVSIESAWIRAAPPGATMLAGYLRLSNAGDTAVAIKEVSSVNFARVEIHETQVVDGVSQMRELETLTLPAKGSVELKPGGKHLMLISPSKSLKVGDSVVLTLSDLADCQISATVAVLKDQAPADSDHHHHHHH